MALVSKSSSKGAGAHFPKSKGGAGVRIGRDGGVNIGTPTKCGSKRAHANVKAY